MKNLFFPVPTWLFEEVLAKLNNFIWVLLLSILIPSSIIGVLLL